MSLALTLEEKKPFKWYLIASTVGAAPTLRGSAKYVAAFSTPKALTCLVDIIPSEFVKSAGAGVTAGTRGGRPPVDPARQHRWGLRLLHQILGEREWQVVPGPFTFQRFIVKHLRVSLITFSFGVALPSEVSEKALATLVQRAKNAAD